MFFFVRKRWDSNPRYAFTYDGFQDRCLQPLSHASGNNVIIVYIFCNIMTCKLFISVYTLAMKYLGIDYGIKKIGIAVSDSNGTIAFPKKIIPHSKDLVQDILDITEDEGIDIVVVGKSLDPWGSENLLQRKIDLFVKKLSYDFDGEVILQDERFSSVAVREHLYKKGNIANEKWTQKDNQRKRDNVDAGAAAIILQRYLDKQ